MYPLTNTSKAAMTKYQVVDIKTLAVVGTYSTVKRARTARDKKDNQYGAYVHRVQSIEA